MSGRRMLRIPIRIRPRILIRIFHARHELDERAGIFQPLQFPYRGRQFLHPARRQASDSDPRHPCQFAELGLQFRVARGRVLIPT